MENELGLALEHHQHGRLSPAAGLYQSLLAQNPNDVDALHLLGVVAHQRGHDNRAEELIARAIALDPHVAAFHANLGDVYRALGKLEQGAACCRTALQLQPSYSEAANNWGLILMGQGQFDAAAAKFRDALQMQPNFAMAQNNLGNALRLAGDLPQAMAEFRRAIELQPNLAEAQTNLGQMLLEQNELDEALLHCREAVRLRPDFPEAQNNLGNVLRDRGDLAEATECYQKSLQLNPNLAMTYNNMAQALQEQGRFDEARTWYQQALQRDPNVARIHCNLASLLIEQEQDAEATRRFEIALRLDPNYAEAHVGLAALLRDDGRHHESLAAYQEAIRLKPSLAAAHSGMGRLLEELGRMSEAEAAFREAIRHDARPAFAYGQLATLQRTKFSEVDFEAMRTLLMDPTQSEAKRSSLYFGLAQVLDARGNYADAAEHLRQANALRQADWEKRGKGYDPDEHARFVDRIIATFTPEFFQRTREFGLPTERPIFIVGLPRSATTLTEQILASHSRVFGAGEQRLAREGFESLPGILNSTALPIDCLAQIDGESIRKVAQWHLDRLSQLNVSADRVVDKMPDNYLYLGFLQVLFPQARFIHTRRDQRDVAVSCWMTSFSQLRWAFNVDHIASRFRQYDRLLKHWRKVLPVTLLEMDYETTVADLERASRRLLEGCGLDWELACLEFHQTARPVRTASVTQVRQPIYSRSVARWKHYEQDLATLFGQLPQRATDVERTSQEKQPEEMTNVER